MTVADVLTIVASLFSGFGGGLLIRSIDQKQKNKEAKQNLDRELQGLMTLIFAEYGHNRATLRLLIREPSLIDVPTFTNLQTAVWNDIKVRLAQHLPKDHIIALVLYYGQIQTILDDINDEEMPPEIKRGVVQDDAKRAEKYGKAAMAYSGKYLFVDHPEYTEDVHEAFVREAQRIMNEGPPEQTDETAG
jgi:hypothetical protein